MTIRANAVELILDCLTNPDTDLYASDITSWKHADSRPLTDSEAALLATITTGEMRAAIDVGLAVEEAENSA
jgi:hypothetical protein